MWMLIYQYALSRDLGSQSRLYTPLSRVVMTAKVSGRERFLKEDEYRRLGRVLDEAEANTVN